MDRPTQMRRELGVAGATLLGLGSIVGTGVFVSIGIAAGLAGPSVVVAVALAAVVATFNGLSSAQLAAAHPVSGGTYEYGYRYLTPQLGFVAGWMFLLAKSASAATAALGFAGYTLVFVDGETDWLVPLALAAVAVLTGVVVAGIRRSNLVNAVLVLLVLGALAGFVLTGLGSFDAANLTPFFEGDVPGLLEATALMFVAYTGYGRVATLGEEVHDPKRTIPIAVVATLLVTMVTYVLVTLTAVGTAGADALSAATAETAAPLEVVARDLGVEGIDRVLAIAAVVAMLGVLLNLLLGLSRVLLAMGRRGDMPPSVGRLDASASPRTAILVMAAVVALLVVVGDVETTWTFSAFTVLVYYALTNLAALRLPAADRRFPRWAAFAGLAACLGLAFWVEPVMWLVGLGLVAVGFGVRAVVRRRVG